MGKVRVRVGKSSNQSLRAAVGLSLLPLAIQLASACGSSSDAETPPSGGTNSGGTGADGGAAGEAGGGSGGARADGGAAGNAGDAGSSSDGGLAGMGAGGCGETCSGCGELEVEVHCSFGSRKVTYDTDDVGELCAAAEVAFAGEGGAGGDGGVAGGNGGVGGYSSSYCDDYVERGEVILGCDFGCLAKDIWNKLGTCTIGGECCVLESYLFCG